MTRTQFLGVDRSAETRLACGQSGWVSPLVCISVAADCELHRTGNRVQDHRIFDKFSAVFVRDTVVVAQLVPQGAQRVQQAHCHHHLQVRGCKIWLMLPSEYQYCDSSLTAFCSMEHSLGQFLFAVIFLALCIMLFTVIGHGLFAGVKRGPGTAQILLPRYKSLTLCQASLQTSTSTMRRTPCCCCSGLQRARGSCHRDFTARSA